MQQPREAALSHEVNRLIEKQRHTSRKRIQLASKIFRIVPSATSMDRFMLDAPAGRIARPSTATYMISSICGTNWPRRVDPLARPALAKHERGTRLTKLADLNQNLVCSRVLTNGVEESKSLRACIARTQAKFTSSQETMIR